MYKVNIADLVHILKQIKISETHVDSGYGPIVDHLGNPIGNLVPYGLRTVSGVLNNLVYPESGAADNVMPRLLAPRFITAPDSVIYGQTITGDGAVLDVNGPAPGGLATFTTDYGAYSDYVVDSQPRTISNLISDQSLANPAALVMALQIAGYPEAQLYTFATQFASTYAQLRAVAEGAVDLGALQAALAAAQAEKTAADANADAAAQALADAEAAAVDTADAQAALTAAISVRDAAAAQEATAQGALAAALTALAAAAADADAAQAALAAAEASRDTQAATAADAAAALTAAEAELAAAQGTLAEAVTAEAAAQTAYDTFLANQGATLTASPEYAALQAATTARVAAEQVAIDAAAAVTRAQQTLLDAQAAQTLALAAQTDAETAVAAAETDLAAAFDAVLTATAERDAAQNTLDSAAADTAAAQTTVNELQGAEDGAQADFDTAAASLTAAGTTEANAAQALVTANEALTAAQANQAAALTTYSNSLTSVALAQATASAASAVVSTAQTSLAQAEATLSTAQTDLTAAVATETAAQADYDAYAATVTPEEAAASPLFQALQDATTARVAAETAVTNATNEVALATSVVTVTTSNLDAANADVVAAQAAASIALSAFGAAAIVALNAQGSVDAATGALASANAALAAAQAAYADAEAVLATATAETDAAIAVLTAAQQVEATAQASLDTASANLTAAQNAEAAAQAALGILNAELADAVAAVATTTANVAAAGAGLTAAQDASAQANANLAQALLAEQTAQAAYDAYAGELAVEQASLLAVLESATAARIAAEAALATATSDEAEARATNDTAATSLAGAESAVAAASAAAAAAASAAADTAAAVAPLQADAASAASALAAAQASVDEAQAAYDAVSGGAPSVAAAQATLDAALAAQATANATVASAEAALTASVNAPELAAAQIAQMTADLEALGVTVENNTVVIPNVMADLGDTAPFNSFMTLFGQFFDHGLDLVSKGDSGLVFIPLLPDDPLYVEGSDTNFMVLTRATNQPGADGILGTADDVREHTNETTPWIDLNQVYTSHEAHQVFLREYKMVDGRPMATGHMLEGAHGGPPTWADIKAQARDMLGIELTDADVLRVPLVASDLYGNFIPGANGFAQIVTTTGLMEGNPAAPVAASGALGAGRAFLNDIAHTAGPVVDAQGNLAPDTDLIAGTAMADLPTDSRGNLLQYDNELLDAHFIVGDGRGNENIGLTAVHHVFHAEHNRVVEQMKAEIIAGGDVAFLNEWLLVPVTAIPADPSTLEWNGERLFQAGRFSTEMVYQHLVFEEFARTVTPDIDPFLFSNSVEISGDIMAEFAHVVYRFGHSMLNETVDRLSADGQTSSDIGLIEAFLNPLEYVASGDDSGIAAGAIIRGMSRQVGNEIDEYLTEALRNNLVGLPLDLGALNIARARETGVPTLNEARAQFFAQTNDTRLEPYQSWFDFALAIKNPASIINFIAAYGQHESVLAATTLEEKRDAAALLVVGGAGAPADRLDYLNSTGAWANRETGLNMVDFWIGGLAEKKMPFGGMLGTTFTFIFEYQMENLQEGDRFYYLSRTQGMNMLNQLESDSFAELVMRNTDLGDGNTTHLPSSLFLTPDHILELNQSLQNEIDPVHTNPILQAISPMVIRRDTDNNGVDDYLRYTGTAHVVIGGTHDDNTLIGGEGDDTIWGDGGNDRLEGGFGVDHLFGGEGDDIITDTGADIGAADVIHGDAGNDVINAGIGLDLVFGGSGQDFIFGGQERKTVNGGEDNDFIRGPDGLSFLMGNEGDDWMEGGDSFDILAGDNSELFFNSSIMGHDVLNGRGNDNDYDAESGDDIMLQGLGIQRNNGMAGFDWAINKGNPVAADSDLGIPIFVNQQANILRDRYDLVEGLSGWNLDDVLTGRDVVIGAYGEEQGAAAQFDPTSPYVSYANALTQEGVDRITGFSDLVAHLARETFTVAGKQETVVVFDEALVQRDGNGNALTMFDGPSDIIIGGGGSDIIMGKDGNDIIDGDRWLNVRIGIKDAQGNDIGWADELGSVVTFTAPGYETHAGRTLDAMMFDRTLNPGQLYIIREILDGDLANSDTDIAVFRGNFDEYEITRNNDGSYTVAHVNPADPQIVDGTDRLFNIEILRFADRDFSSAPTLDLSAFQTSTFADQFGQSNYANSNGTTPWTSTWQEAGDVTTGNVVTGGQIRINGGQLVFGDNDDDPGNGGSQITRTVDLSAAGTGTARLSFSYQEQSFDAGEQVQVQFAADGTNFVTLLTLNNTSNNGTADLVLTGPFTANAAVRFVVSGTNNNSNNDQVRIDNLQVSYTAPVDDGTVDWTSSFTEGGAAAGISSLPLIAGTETVTSARVVLTNAKAGDTLTATTANGLPAGISVTSVNANGVITLTLTGTATAAGYQQALDAVRFANTSNTPDTEPRVIQVTVSADGIESDPATATISVAAVDTPMTANNDSVITNFGNNQAFEIPISALLANDADPDSPLAISAITGSFSASATLGAATITATDTGNFLAGGSFTYRGTGTDTATVNLDRDNSGTLDGTNGDNIIIGNDASSTINGGGGNDRILAGAGDDRIEQTSTQGRDFVDGQAGNDTWVLNGVTGAETFRIYERSAAEAAGIVVDNATTEIVITRQTGTGAQAVIAELDNIEEIIVSTLGVTTPGGANGGNVGGDTVQVIGNFNTTSLNFNTITINGSDANDTVDITQLGSAHRIVFDTNGGQDTVVGTLRPQDIVNQSPGEASSGDHEAAGAVEATTAAGWFRGQFMDMIREFRDFRSDLGAEFGNMHGRGVLEFAYSPDDQVIKTVTYVSRDRSGIDSEERALGPVSDATETKAYVSEVLPFLVWDDALPAIASKRTISELPAPTPEIANGSGLPGAWLRDWADSEVFMSSDEAAGSQEDWNESLPARPGLQIADIYDSIV
jgi:hypothetical protein